MKKIKFFLAAMASVALVSCMNDEFVGNSPGTTAEADTQDAISFSSGRQAVTRGDLTGGSAATMLGNAFKVYGVKQNRTTTTNYDQVFGNFTVKYATAKDGNAEYNDGWYYVGAESGQTIRYWDYASADYHFVAGSPVANFTYATDGTTGDIKTATITGLGGRLNHSTTVASAAAVYIADPVVMTKPTPAGTKYGEVKFSFKSMQSKVRVGIYETVPGYKITSIQFYNNATPAVASNYITLNCATDNYFQGSSSTGVEGTVTYNWATPTYTFAYSTVDGKKPTLGKYWEGGQYTAGVKAVNSTNAVADLYGAEDSRDANGYFIVMPTPSGTDAAALTLKCDYVLKSLDNVDEIHVTGATATIPADYTKWAPNTAYTYLFKITDNTNGSTGTPDTDPAGLYPITFDAVVVNVADGIQNIGTETTFSTPSITCYQNGNVVDDDTTTPQKHGIKFVAGEDVIVKTSAAATITVQKVDGAFDYGKAYNQQSYVAAFGTKTLGTDVNSATFAKADISDNTTYVIMASTATANAYFVLVVGAAESGPAN